MYKTGKKKKAWWTIRVEQTKCTVKITVRAFALLYIRNNKKVRLGSKL